MPEQSKRNLKHEEEDLDPEKYDARSICNLIRQKTGHEGVGEFILEMMESADLTFQELDVLEATGKLSS